MVRISRSSPPRVLSKPHRAHQSLRLGDNVDRHVILASRFNLKLENIPILQGRTRPLSPKQP